MRLAWKTRSSARRPLRGRSQAAPAATSDGGAAGAGGSRSGSECPPVLTSVARCCKVRAL